MAVMEPQWLKYKTTDDRQSTFAVYAVLPQVQSKKEWRTWYYKRYYAYSCC